MEWHSASVEEVIKALGTTPNGLSTVEATARLDRFGPNRIAEAEQVSAWRILREELTGFFNIILFSAAMTAIAVGYLPGQRPRLHEVVFICTIIVLNTLISFMEEYKASRSIQSLRGIMRLRASVVRQGEEQVVDAGELVPGDVIVLAEGDKVPADGRIMEAFGLKVDESILTGESENLDKDDRSVPPATILAERTDMLYSGTFVVRGSARAVVTATGMDSEIGRIAADLYGVVERPTPFQREVAKLSRQITVAIAAIVAVIAVTSAVVEHLGLYDVLINSISLGVAAVPASLPVVMTFALAMGTRKMLEKKALVRRLSVVESLGSVDVVCTDKTGTLTENRMSVEKVYCDGMISETGAVRRDSRAVRLLVETALLCNDAGVRHDGGFIGDATEVALLRLGELMGVSPRSERQKYPKTGEIPFSSEKRRMTTIHTVDGMPVAYAKGALGAILPSCGGVLKENGVVPLTEQERIAITAAADAMAAEALRVLAFAYKGLVPGATDSDAETGMVFLGLAGMMDPPRVEVGPSVRTAHAAGIRVVMITGDNRRTAQAIAGRLGIEGDVVEGREIDDCAVEVLAARAAKIAIVARATPRTKYRMTQALQEIGHFVAMTGDGVNDAIAIRQADVGIAMGERGTDVAKEASDMVLLDDNFKTIVDAVEEGRRIFDNIKKFVNYLLSANLAEVFVILILSFFGYTPLTGIMVLWVNMVTDILPASAIAIDPANPGIIRRPPRKVGEPVLNRGVKALIAFSGVKKIVVLLLIFLVGVRMGGEQLAQTMVFTSVILFSFVRIMIVRQMDQLSIWSNGWLLLAMATGIGLQLMVLYTPPIREFFHVLPLAAIHWAVLVPIVLVSALLGTVGARIIMRFIPAI